MVKKVCQTTRLAIVLICCLVVSASVSIATAQDMPPPQTDPTTAQGFIVKDIEVEGLKRVEAGTIFVALPLQVGDFFAISRSPEVLKAIYDLRLFDDVKLRYTDEKLIIAVTERPGIAEIIISGNQVLPTDGMIEGLKSIGIAKGNIYDRTAFDRLQEELKQQYYALGKYSVQLDMQAVEIPDNKVNLEINIDEGESTRIREVKITGNERIDTKTLTEDFQSGLRPWYDLFGDRDLYSKVRLEADLEALRNVYFNRGYLDATVDDVQVTLTPDKKYINILIQISEGEIYTIKSVDISRKKVKGLGEIKQQLMVKKGQVFSRERAIASNNVITNFLKDQGYAFAQVSMVPQKNPDDSTINLLYIPQPDERVYVRRITFSNSSATNDDAFRSQVRQLESAPYSQHNINLSRKRLQRLPYVTEVKVEEKPVAGSDNQVDIDFKVTERFSGSFNVGAGYSEDEGAVVSINIVQDNFAGTGNRVRFAFSNSETHERYGIGVTDPHYTVDGISRSWGLNYVSTDFRNRNTSGSGSSEFSASLSYGIPVSEDDTLGLGIRLQNINLSRSSSTVAEVQEFLDREGRSFTNLILSASLTYDTRNRSIFPTTGLRTRGSLEWFTPLSDLTYAKATFDQEYYIPLDEEKNWIFVPRVNVAYGTSYGATSEVPYYDRFYAGGNKSVRGYEGNSLGERDDDDRALGGEFRFVNSYNLFFPTGALYDPTRLRAGIFTDIGNVFDEASDLSFSDLRGSVGLGIQWLTAVGAINLNFAAPFNDGDDDQTRQVQFDFGSGF